MALYRHTDMVGAIAGTCRVKFLPGFASGESENTLAQAQALRAGFASRLFAFGCSWRPPAASRRNRALCFCRGSRSGSPTRWRLGDPRQHAFGGLEIGRLSDDVFAVGIEAGKPFADLRLLCADLVQYRRCCGWHGDLAPPLEEGGVDLRSLSAIQKFSTSTLTVSWAWTYLHGAAPRIAGGSRLPHDR